MQAGDEAETERSWDTNHATARKVTKRRPRPTRAGAHSSSKGQATRGGSLGGGANQDSLGVGALEAARHGRADAGHEEGGRRLWVLCQDVEGLRAGTQGGMID